jgi:ATP-dependent helicase HrpA
VSLVLADTREEALASTRRGVVRLIRFALKDAFTRYEKGLPGFTQAALMLKPAIPADRLLADLLDANRRSRVRRRRHAAARRQGVRRAGQAARARLPAVADAAFKLVATIAASYHAVGQKLAQAPAGWASWPPSFGRSATSSSPRGSPRRCRGPSSAPAALTSRRSPAAGPRPASGPTARRATARRSRRGRAAGASGATRDRSTGRPDPALDDFRWLLEELRVSLFAQELKTPTPVSLKRVEKAWAVLEGR